MLQIPHFQPKGINLMKTARSLGQVFCIKRQHHQHYEHVMGNCLPSTLLEQFILVPASFFYRAKGFRPSSMHAALYVSSTACCKQIFRAHF